MSKDNKKPTHELKIVADTYKTTDDDGKEVTKQITETVGAFWFNEDGKYAGGEVTRNRVLMKGDRLKLFTISDDSE